MLQKEKRTINIYSKYFKDNKLISFTFWVVAFSVGIIAGFAAVLFRFLVSWLQEIFYQSDEITLLSKVHNIPWAWLLLLPVLGGLSVGLIIFFF